MPPQRFEWLQRIKNVEREYAVTRLSVDHILEAATRDPTSLIQDLRVRDVRRAAERLDGTYVIRLFAEFESGLRSFWATLRPTNPKAEDLLEGIAARRQIPQECLANAHAVREYRNHLVHEGDEPVAIMAVSDARRSLCIYLSFLPLDW